jgi:hypothetical protein
MRRIRLTAATVVTAAGLIGAVAAPASAAEPGNYGTCVSSGVLDPNTSNEGPNNIQAQTASGGSGGIAVGNSHSGGKPRFTSDIGC